jgi:hypothetical protein
VLCFEEGGFKVATSTARAEGRASARHTRAAASHTHSVSDGRRVSRVARRLQCCAPAACLPLFPSL